VATAGREEGMAGWKEVSAGREEVAATCELVAATGVMGKGTRPFNSREKKTVEKNLMWTQICFFWKPFMGNS
jgi:hypothetical protein